MRNNLALAKLLRQGQDFLFKPPCPICQRTSASTFCQDCSRKIAECRRRNYHIQAPELPPLYCWGRYESTLKQSLAKLKYDHQERVAIPLGQYLGELWQASFAGVSAAREWSAIPIPLHRERQRQRGYNQADLIAQSFCKVVGLRLKSQGLIRPRATTAQYGLSRVARYENLQHAFIPGPDLSGLAPSAQVILIDDIFTTGATLKAAVNTLQRKGIQVAALLAVAASQPDS